MENLINVSFISKDKKKLGEIKKEVQKKKEILVDNIELQSIPGAIETLSILGITISILSGVIAQVAGALIYDLFKKNKSKKDLVVYINGNQVSSKEEIYQLLEGKKIKKKSGDKKKKREKSK
jgi:hypothetical protein